MDVQTDRADELANRRFLSAWEAQQHLKRGEAIGEARGVRQMLVMFINQRFGDAAQPLLERIEQISDPAVLRALGVQSLQASSLEELLSVASA